LNDKKKLIVIAGPTAVGKTDLAIKLATYLNCDIISADSRQLYKEINIGTAKPSLEERRKVRHYFIDYKSIHEYYSAGRFEVDVGDLLRDYEKNYILLVGGSGLYVKAVCEGIDEMPGPDLNLRKSLQRRFEENGLEDLTEELKIMDPDSWNALDLQNPKRVIRALEIVHQTGKKFSELKVRKKQSRNFDILKIGLHMPREVLFNRINARVDKMIDQGLLEEVRSLWPWSELTALETVVVIHANRKLSPEFSPRAFRS